MRTLLSLVFLFSPAVQAVPVVPQFTQGSVTSHQETTTKITETINSIDINTGWQYSVTGTNMKHSGSSVSPTTTTAPSQTTDGITYTWVGLDHSNKPNWQLQQMEQPFSLPKHTRLLGSASKQLSKERPIKQVSPIQQAFFSNSLWIIHV